MTLAPPRVMDPRKLGGAGSRVIGDNLRALFGTGLLHNIFCDEKLFLRLCLACAQTPVRYMHFQRLSQYTHVGRCRTGANWKILSRREREKSSEHNVDRWARYCAALSHLLTARWAYFSVERQIIIST